MGLAASQARFLAITSRKMNCEFQSMQIAQDKLSVTRDLQSATTKYQNALNATKLVWDTDMDEVYDLSYELLMTPSALNDYNPYIITDGQGKVVLTDSMFDAAVAAGIIDENGDPIHSDADGNAVDLFTQEMRNKFIDEMASKGEIAFSTANSVKSYEYTKAGIGGEIIDKTIANALTSNSFIKALGAEYDEDTNTHKKGDLKYGLNDSILGTYGLLSALGVGVTDTNSDGTINTEDINAAWDKTFCYTTSPDTTNDNGKIIITQNGTALSREQIQNLSLGDLLSGNYAMTVVGSIGGQDGKASKMLKAMATLLGYAPGSTTANGIGLNVDMEANNALQTAMEFTESLLIGDPATSTTGVSTAHAVANSTNESKNYNGIVKTDKGVETINLTNLLKSYITNFAIATDGLQETLFSVNDSVKDSTYATDDLNYTFLLEEKAAVTETDLLTTDFYNQLYNQICMNGATTDSIKRDMVSDPEYLMQALKNGQLFISSLNTDGYFYQGAYILNGYVQEVTDEEAIAQAELEYELTKNKLNYKEETLELKMKNIDTELSALTTEYDTVKNLISKNVEKVFTMFST